MKILIFGASIAQGYYDTECGGWANRLHVYTMQKTVESDWEKDVAVFNLGISGDTIARLRKRFEQEFNLRWNTEKGPALTLFSYGINDSMTDKEGNHRTSIDKFKLLYAEYISKAKESGGVVIVGLTPIDESVLDPIPWHTTHSYLEKNRALFDTAVQELASKNECVYISMDGVWGDDIAGHTTDGIHPNTEGHRLMFERVKESLEKEGLL